MSPTIAVERITAAGLQRVDWIPPALYQGHFDNGGYVRLQQDALGQLSGFYMVDDEMAFLQSACLLYKHLEAQPASQTSVLHNYTVIYTAQDHLPPHNGRRRSNTTENAECPLHQLMDDLKPIQVSGTRIRQVYSAEYNSLSM